MSQIVTAANAKVVALWECIMRWSNELSGIKPPQDMYQQRYEDMRHRFDNELQRLIQNPDDLASYQRGTDTLLQLAGQIKELETQYKQSVALMEQDFQARLDVIHNRLACDMVDALGDTIINPQVRDKFQQALACQKSVVETGTAREEHHIALDPLPDLNPNSSPNKQATVETHVAPDANQNSRLRQYLEDSTSTNQTPEGMLTFGEVNISVSREAPDLRNNSVEATSSVMTTNVSQQQSESASNANSTVSGVVPRMEPALESGSATGSSLSPETSFSLSENAVQCTEPSEDPKLAAGENVTQNEMTQGTIASRVSARFNQLANPREQTRGGRDKTPPVESWNINRLRENSLIVHLRIPAKRPRMTTMDQQQKRPRYDNTPTNSTEERLINFDRVFQDGKAQIKFLIVQYPPKTGNWYILECKEHGKHFTKNPLKGAGKHLASNEHGLTREHSVAVDILGTRVINCDATLAEKNNVIAKEAFACGLGSPSKRQDSDERRQSHVGDKNEDRRPLQAHSEKPRFSEIVDMPSPGSIIIPSEGKIYATRYPKLRFFYPVLVLPWTSLAHFGWKAALLRLTPPCYTFEKKSDQYPRGWAEGYEDGGKLIGQRYYPVIYFDGRRFPDQCDVGWVPVSSLRTYDPNDANIVHRTSVAEYILHEDSRLLTNSPTPPKQCIIVSDDSDSDNADIRRDVRRLNSELGLVCDKRAGNSNENMEIEKHIEKRTTEGNSGAREKGSLGGSSSPGSRHYNKSPGVDHNSISQNDVDLAAGSISEPQTDSHIHRATPEHSQTNATTFLKRRIEAPFVSGDSADMGQAALQPFVIPAGPVTERRLPSGVEEPSDMYDDTAQLSISAVQRIDSQPQYSQIPVSLPQENLTTLAAQARAVVVTASEIAGNGRSAPLTVG
ncbi:hypothetical protein NW762_012836 [Fusarium torreyae]|uniref:Uncharacterized protein n=1 Tax=Fusarium torreyae TaxID=1237075 RepID=A0A9W8V899_9HYPO|nr:hypothetical protein NW762_012836 [Fusarium torreyae]